MSWCPMCSARIAWATPEETAFVCGCIIDNETDTIISECENSAEEQG